MRLKRTGIVLNPDRSRVLFREFIPVVEQRSLKIIARVMSLPEAEVTTLFEEVMTEFRGRHHSMRAFFQARFEQVRSLLLTDAPLSEARQLLIGSYFTLEYSLESAALFNPSMVWHPDQSDLLAGSRRFILSLRATGEGHLSSITFRSGVIDAENRISMDATTRYVAASQLVPDADYQKSLFEKKLTELGLTDNFTSGIMASLGEHFTMDELKTSLRIVAQQNQTEYQAHSHSVQAVLTLAQSNYEVVYSLERHLSERIIFPHSPTEINGIEDARFVQFYEEDGSTRYYATYTAYDGKMILPQMLETQDFLRFKMSTLNGPEVQNKGLALFPRRINGCYAMISRQDNENIYIMFSEMLHFWHTKQLILKPTFPWEFVQLGNCGSPIETEAGWLVLSHGVGPVRKYSIGAFLLDLKDPTRVIGRLREPLLTPDTNEREGYVPNVVYSCGAQVHNGDLIIPYAMSDYASTIATVPLQDVLDAMK